MRLLDARWTPEIIELLLFCGCGCMFWYRSDKLWIICPDCGARFNMHDIKAKGVAK